MKVELLPLKGKYYGTKIKIYSDEGTEYLIELWATTECIPSDRELESIGCSRKDWDENIMFDNGFNSKEPIQEIGLFEFSHTETQETYELAKEIVNKLNN